MINRRLMNVRYTLLVLLLFALTSNATQIQETPQETSSEKVHAHASKTKALSTTSATSSPTQATGTTTANKNIIPLGVFFNDPKYAMVRVSPNGQYVAFLSPSQGVLNIWVADIQNPQKARPITQNKSRRVSSYYWAQNNEQIIYLDDKNGDENWRLHSADIKTGKVKPLIDIPNVKVQILDNSQYFPDEMMVGVNDRRPEFHDVYRLNTKTGERKREYENNQFVGFVFDDHLNPRLGMAIDKAGDGVLSVLAGNPIQIQDTLMNIKHTDLLSTTPIGFNQTGDTLYLIDSRDRNTAALMSLNLKNKQLTLLGEDKKADVDGLLIHPSTQTIQGYATNYERKQWTILDKTLESDFQYLKTVAKGDIDIVNRSLDDKKWIVIFNQDNRSPHYYVYDRSSSKATFLFAAKPELESLALNSMDPVIIQSRDNLPMVSYLTLPNHNRQSPAKAKAPVPLILLVHGGPAMRDSWEYDPEHQWLSNRGYAVLSVNFRGSTGFGKHFANAGNGEWGQKMQNDLIDAVNWAIQQGITTKDKVAIMGGSYGGYATLMGLTKTPDVFACGVDIVGPSNLVTLLQSIPPYWKPLKAFEKIRIGDDETESGRKKLADRSPLTYANQIIKPLLIAQGANDPRVKQAESEQIVEKMTQNNIPVTYVLFPDEGHGFQKPQNRLAFYSVVEAFFAEHLGGKFNSSEVNQYFKRSSIHIKTGKEYIKDL